MPKTARIGRYGQEMSAEIAFGDNATVDDVLTHFEEELAKGETLAINGTPVNGRTVFKGKVDIFIVPSTTGA